MFNSSSTALIRSSNCCNSSLAVLTSLLGDERGFFSSSKMKRLTTAAGEALGLETFEKVHFLLTTFSFQIYLPQVPISDRGDQRFLLVRSSDPPFHRFLHKPLKANLNYTLSPGISLLEQQDKCECSLVPGSDAVRENRDIPAEEELARSFPLLD